MSADHMQAYRAGERRQRIARRVHEAVELLAQGLTLDEAAERMTVEQRTVAMYLWRYNRRYGLRGRSEAIAHIRGEAQP